MQKTLNLGAIGLKGWSLADSAKLAGDAGFDSVSFDIVEAVALADAQGIDAVKAIFTDAGVAPAFWSLPFPINDDEKRITGLANLPRQIEVANHLGVPLAASGIWPASNDRDYEENFAWHVERLGPVAAALAAGGIRLALEFIGPKTLRSQYTYEFTYSMPLLLDLIRATGATNVGLTLDIWHLYTAGGENSDIDTISKSDVDIVHLNDAPPGIDRDDQQDLVRALPLETGVLDVADFMRRLQALGFNGPVMAEPFSAALEELAVNDPLAAARKTLDSLDAVWSASGLS